MASPLNLLVVAGFDDMPEVWVPIIVAFITGPVVVVLGRLRKENSEQHAEGRVLLREIGVKVDRVGTTLDKHIGWHEGKEDTYTMDGINIGRVNNGTND